jgi:hypothetical protein
VQALQPLAVEHVALGPRAAVPRLGGLDEVDLEALGLEQLEQRHPVDAGRLQHDGGDLVRGEV